MSRPQQIAFALVFAVFGIVVLVKVFAATTTSTYTGKLTATNTADTYYMSVTASGTATATFTYGGTLAPRVRIFNPSGVLVASGTGRSPIIASAPVSLGKYKVVVSRVSGAGNYTVGLTYPVPDDTTPPVVSFTNPANGSSLSGAVSVTGAASDNAAVSKTEVSIDGAAYQVATGTASWSYSWNTATGPNGSHTLIARAVDTNGNITTSSVTVSVNNPVVDTTPPTAPGNLSGTTPNPNQVNLTWTASSDQDNPASDLRYRVYRNSTLIATTAAGATSYLGSGLLASTTYSFNVIAIDPANNTSTSSNAISLKTQDAPVGDTTLPTVTITNPTPNSVLTNTVTITGTASDNVGVAKVEVFFNNTWHLATGTTNWSYDWDTKPFANGTYYGLAVRATDTSGNGTPAAVTVSIKNAASAAPTVSITSPATNSTLGGVTKITGTASADVTRFALVVSGNNTPLFSLGVKGTTYWTSALNSISLPPGNYTLAMTAYNSTYSATTSINFSIAVAYAEPTVTVNSPGSGATVSGTFTASGTASSPVGIQSVTAYMYQPANVYPSDLIYPVTGTTSWSAAIDTSKLINGDYKLIVVAHDGYGYNQVKNIPITIKNNTGTGNPKVAISSPLNGTNVSGTITLKGTASGLNLNFLAATDSASRGWRRITGVNNWTDTVDTTKMSNGSQKIYVYADDIQNGLQYTANAVVTVYVNNPSPTVSINSPASGAVVNGNLTITGSASDGTGGGLDKVMVGIDSDTPRIASGVGDWSISYNSYGLTYGNHTVNAVAYSKNGTPSVAATRTVSVQNGSIPTPTTKCSIGGNTLPLYDQYVSTDGKITVQICTTEGAWTAEEAYNAFRSVAIHPGMKGIDDLSTFDHISFAMQPSSAPYNGMLSSTYNFQNKGAYGVQYTPVDGTFYVGAGSGSRDPVDLMSHEYLHLWSFGGELSNPVNWTGSYTGIGQPYGYPSLDNLTRIAGANGDPILKSDYIKLDGNDVFAETAGSQLNCGPLPCGIGSPGTNGLPVPGDTPGWLDYIKTKWWQY